MASARPPAGAWKVGSPPHGPIVFACRKSRPRPPIWPTGSSAWQTCRGTFIWPKKRAIRAWGGGGVPPRQEPSDRVAGYGSPEFDAEGRYLELRFDTPARKLSIISAYFPSGSSGPLRQQAKFRFLAE